MATKLKLLMEYKQEEKNKAESQGNSDIRSILNELHEFKMDLKELKTLNELQQIKTDLAELKKQLSEKTKFETQGNFDIRSIVNELKDFQTDQKTQVNSVVRSINELKDFQSDQKAHGNTFMRAILNDLTELKTQLSKQQVTLSNTTPPKK